MTTVSRASGVTNSGATTWHHTAGASPTGTGKDRNRGGRCRSRLTMRPYEHDRACPRPDRAAPAPDAALDRAPDRVHGVLPPALRRHVQRALPRLHDAAGHGLRSRGDPRAVHDARERAAAGADADARAHPRQALDP